MTIKQLYPPFERPMPVAKRQCCAVVIEAANQRLHEWRKNRYGRHGRGDYDPQRCQRQGQYEIDGQPFCALHASKEALARWMDGDLIESTVLRKEYARWLAEQGTKGSRT